MGRARPIAILFLLATTPIVPADDDLVSTAKRLVAQLDDADPKKRDAAEADILRIGHRLLDHLPDQEDMGLSSEQRFRLTRVIPMLRSSRAKSAGEASHVRIDSKENRLADLVLLIERQTGNRLIDQRNEGDAPPITVSLEPGDFSFWPVVDEIARQGNVSLNLHGKNRAVALVPGPVTQAPTHYKGAFRFAIDRVLLSQDFRRPDDGKACVVDVSVQVEPRLKPIQMQLLGHSVGADDDQGNRLTYKGPENAYLGFEENAIETKMPLRFECPPRSATKLKHIEGGLEVLLPSQVESFAFDRKTGLRDVVVKRPGLTLTLQGFQEEDEGIWAAKFTVERDPRSIELDSFLRASLKNELHLEDADGKRMPQDGGMNSQELGDGKTQFEYLFVDLPGKIADYKLRLAVPAGVVRIPITFAFDDVPLP